MNVPKKFRNRLKYFALGIATNQRSGKRNQSTSDLKLVHFKYSNSSGNSNGQQITEIFTNNRSKVESKHPVNNINP